MMLLESLPDEVTASLEIRDSWRRKVAESGHGLEFIVSDLARWRPGVPVRVAFLDGDADLHQAIAEATQQLTDACGLSLDFGRHPQTGELRRWSLTDTDYSAEIRVSFDMGGYWSLVGNDSTDRLVGGPGQAVGGAPHQRSLNLGGFATSLPEDWEGTVRHEFLHAVGFHHAHQNMRGPCADEFRWEDDKGYQPTRDSNGVFVKDANGRAPGIYTYLAGAPNHWPRSKVDHNLRTRDSADVTIGPFDPESVMLYSFAEFFYRSFPNPCAPTGNGVDLSEGDKRGLRLLYPQTPEEVDDLRSSAASTLTTLQGRSGQELGGSTDSPYQQRVVELLTQISQD